jgi:DnaJ family protein C protein 28
VSDKDWESWIDQQVREAQERGAFDDLPGKGRPIDLTSNPYAQDQELAFKILRDAGFAPEWIELDKAIRSQLERARQVLSRQWSWRTTRLAELADRRDAWADSERARVEGQWHRALSVFEQEIDTINAEISRLNLMVPSPRFQRLKVKAAGEVAQLTAELA